MRWFGAVAGFLSSVLFLVMLTGCRCPECEAPEGFDVTLSPTRVLSGESVEVRLSREANDIRVMVGGSELAAEKQSATQFTFRVPRDAASGLQEVMIQAQGGSSSAMLDIFGQDIVEGEAVIAFQSEASDSGAAALTAFLDEREFTLIEFTDLEGAVGPCSGALARIDIGERTLGEALEELEAFEQEGDVTEYFIDPPTAYSGGNAEMVEKSARIQPLQAEQVLGEGVTLAVIDTGITDGSSFFGSRLLAGYNAITGGSDTPDDSAESHGTTVARIAAGSTLGVAAAANILPVKVCDAQGSCLGSDIIEGVCWALENAPADTQLGLNFSLGGDTRMEILDALLNAAISERDVFVSASAGNDGENGPIHYPAAHDFDGLMAVGTVEQCITFDGLPLGNTYTVGDQFKDAFAMIEVKPFFFLEEGATSDGTVNVLGADLDGAIDNSLSTGNTNLDFSFTTTLAGLSLEFLDQGGNINMSVNESFVNIEDLTELDGEVLGGVEIDIVNDDTQLQLSGDVRTFAIGGQELTIDNVCANSTNSSNTWLPAGFSSWGDYVDIAAPIPVQLVGELKTLGTSFSAPVVAGVGAALRSGNTSLSPAEIQGCIEDSATALTSVSPKAVGAGLLNFEDALSMCGP